MTNHLVYAVSRTDECFPDEHIRAWAHDALDAWRDDWILSVVPELYVRDASFILIGFNDFAIGR
jgi:hypothetical protein